MSVGVIVTRGTSLQNRLVSIVKVCALAHGVEEYDDLGQCFGLQPTARQRRMVEKDVRAGTSLVDAWSQAFVRDKFGTATTHWAKLRERMDRGVGNPCPLLLLGLPATVIKATKAYDEDH